MTLKILLFACPYCWLGKPLFLNGLPKNYPGLKLSVPENSGCQANNTGCNFLLNETISFLTNSLNQGSFASFWSTNITKTAANMEGFDSIVAQGRARTCHGFLNYLLAVKIKTIVIDHIISICCCDNVAYD